MLFSVIVPVYNVEKYLEQCVNSILSQSFTDFELILVDDGSTDKCPQICDELKNKDSRIIVIHKTNGGLSAARNIGIETAHGKYVIFVDSDDFYCSNKVFDKIADEINKSDADIIQFHRKWFYEAEQIFVERKETFHISCKDYSPSIVINQLIKNKMTYFSACQNVVRLSYVYKNKLFFKEGIKSEDIDWGFRVFSYLPRISLLPDIFYVYRTNREGSITSTKKYKNLCDYCDILERAIIMVELGNEEIRDALISHILYHVTICSALTYQVHLSNVEKKSIQKRLSLLCKNRMGKYNIDSRVNLSSKIYRIFGYSGMAFVLGFYLNHRGNSQHSFKTMKRGNISIDRGN